MTWNEFQAEVAFIWRHEDASHAENVKQILRTYAHEIGLMELRGYSLQAQMAFAWEKYKEEFPHL
jgi:hypothetical protein